MLITIFTFTSKISYSQSSEDVCKGVAVVGYLVKDVGLNTFKCVYTGNLYACYKIGNALKSGDKKVSGYENGCNWTVEKVSTYFSGSKSIEATITIKGPEKTVKEMMEELKDSGDYCPSDGYEISF